MGTYTCVTETQSRTFIASVKGLKEVFLGTYRLKARQRVVHRNRCDLGKKDQELIVRNCTDFIKTAGPNNEKV